MIDCCLLIAVSFPRNLEELQMETVTLAQESKEMEEKLQQLKDSMSKEKKERG